MTKIVEFIQAEIKPGSEPEPESELESHIG